MDQFEGYPNIAPDLRYKNEMLYHARRQTELLEQLAQLLQRDKPEVKDKRPYTRRERA